MSASGIMQKFMNEFPPIELISTSVPKRPYVEKNIELNEIVMEQSVPKVNLNFGNDFNVMT